MGTAMKNAVEFNEGMMVSDLRESTSIKFINTLRENELIRINRKGQISLTQKGKIASKLGVNNYLRMEKVEKQFIEQELYNVKVENRGLTMIFGGMVISLLLIIGFWIMELQTL
ncbi:MAG: hypothetical protein KJO51_00680 [Gramella sp.]|nr:hypothetical protein [Christiangramia sp.]